MNIKDKLMELTNEWQGDVESIANNKTMSSELKVGMGLMMQAVISQIRKVIIESSDN